MGQATNLALRERLLELRQSGQTLKAISEALGLPYSTTKKLSRRFREKGELGLAPDYQNCGRHTGEYGSVPYQDLARQLKELHPSWGAPRLRVELSLTQQTQGNLPSIRTLQRWYRKWGLTRPRRKGADPSIGRSTAPHNIWEVDAKENLSLSDGRPGCYLTIGDEKSGAWLEALVFPLS